MIAMLRRQSSRCAGRPHLWLVGLLPFFLFHTMLQAKSLAPVRGAWNEATSRSFLPELEKRTIWTRSTQPLAVSEEDAIRLLYTNYLGKIQASGQEMRLELSNFYTVYRSEFSGVYFDDLVTTRPRVYIESMITEYSDKNGHFYGIAYRASWTKPDAQLEESDEPGLMTVADLVAHLEMRLPHWADIVAFTVFDVEVTLAEQSSSYSAGVFWRLGPNGEFTALPQDSVLTNWDILASEERPAINPNDIPRLVEERAFRQGELSKAQGALEDINTSSRCKLTSTGQVSPTFSLADVTNHAFDPATSSYIGLHVANFRTQWSCTCSSNCSQTCTGSTDFQSCRDTVGSALGDPDSTHRGTATGKVTIATSERGDQLPTQCAYDYICAIQQCFLDRVCDPMQFTFRPFGIGVQWTAFGEGLTWTAEVRFTHQCSFCEIQIESPILIDLGHTGLELSDLSSGVLFDIDANGTADRISWVAPNASDAFLVLDRNRNGSIDSGAELFGNATAQPDTDEPNGFLALAVFDGQSEGGNSDGWITVADEVYDDLRLWLDRDADGTTDPGELMLLEAQGVRAIGLSYVTSERKDRFGNRSRWAAPVRFETGQALAAIDVIFLRE